MSINASRMSASWTAFWRRPGSPYDLAATRIVISLHGLWLLLSRDLPALSGLPDAMWATPTHAYWRYLVLPGHPTVEYVGQLVAIVALLAVMLGVATRASGFVAALLLYRLAALETLFWSMEPTTRGFGITIICLVVLATAPCADVWKVGGPHRHVRPGWSYGWPLRLIQVFIVQVYFFSAWAKLVWGGVGWFTLDNVRGHILQANVGQAMLFSELPMRLIEAPLLLYVAVVGSVVLEFAFPLVMFSRWARRVLVPLTFAFHVGVVFALNIAFPGVPRLLVFVNWDWVRSKWPRTFFSSGRAVASANS